MPEVPKPDVSAPHVSTKRCPYCAEEIRLEAVKCRYCGSIVEGYALTRTWHRARRGKRIAGVCAGLAREFGISVTIVRLAFVLGTVFGGGTGVIIYLVLWAVMPYEPDVVPALIAPGESP